MTQPCQTPIRTMTTAANPAIPGHGHHRRDQGEAPWPEGPTPPRRRFAAGGRPRLRLFSGCRHEQSTQKGPPESRCQAGCRVGVGPVRFRPRRGSPADRRSAGPGPDRRQHRAHRPLLVARRVHQPPHRRRGLGTRHGEGPGRAHRTAAAQRTGASRPRISGGCGSSTRPIAASPNSHRC